MSKNFIAICWFCKKNRHNECMKKIPINNDLEGISDCTFSTDFIQCACNHK